MRILFCNKYNFPFSGTEVYLFELMRMLREQGHEVALFAMDDPRGPSGAHPTYPAPLVDFKAVAHGWTRSARLAAQAIYSRRARRSIRRAIEEFRPDVAHVRNIYHHLSPSILWELKRQHVPVLYHVNDFKLLCPNYNLVAGGKTCERCLGGRFWNVVARGCYSGGRAQAAVLAVEAYIHRWLHTYEKCVDAILAPSRFVRGMLVNSGWPVERVRVLPHFQRVEPDVPPGPAPDAPILYFGRLSEEKGLDDLLLAMKELPAIRLRIAGDGPIRSSLGDLARERGLANVSFVGHQPASALNHLIAESKFTVFPSHAFETLGKAILESYAQGRAVIASDLGSRREFVIQRKTGLLYEPGNTSALAAAIALLHEHADLATRMGSAAREYVRSNHSPAEHLQSLTDLYRELCAGKLPVAGLQSPGQRPVTDRGWLVAQERFIRDVAPRRSAKPRMRIAFIGGRGVIGKYSGIEGYYEEVGRHLAAAGHEVTVYCRSYFTPRQARHNGMRLVRLPALRSKHLETALHTLMSTAHVMFRGCDIVHYHALGPALFSFLPRLAGKKTAVTVQGLDWQRKKWGAVASAVLRLGEQAAVQFPHTTMVVSRTLKSHFREHHWASTEYVPNGAPLREIRAGLLDEWGIEPGRYVLFLGRFSPEKNCHLLVEAFERIPAEAKLVLAGGSNTEDSYSRELRQHASDRIVLLDYVSGPQFDALLTSAMLFVLPSDLEGLSLALLEAMGAGICVLASDIPENRELVDGAGFTFKRGDASDLERMLRILMFSPALREDAGRAARDRIRDQYQWPVIAAEIERIYYAMLGCEPGMHGQGAESAREGQPGVEQIA
jgi:glycosyltransferase involved in cell wall biosynthesis